MLQSMVVNIEIGIDCLENKILISLDNEQIMESLLKNSADVNFANNRGMTALHWAALYGTIKV